MSQAKYVSVVDDSETDKLLNNVPASAGESQDSKLKERSSSDRWEYFKQNVLEPATEWFLNTHSSMISTYTFHKAIEKAWPTHRTYAYKIYVLYIRLFFKSAFAFDGLNLGANTVITADGKSSQLSDHYVPPSLWILSFLGLPSRPESVKDENFTFSFMQFLRNLIGGFNPIHETLTGKVAKISPVTPNAPRWTPFPEPRRVTFNQPRWTEKKIISTILILFKLFVIVPIKLITFPFKFLLNLIKLVAVVLLRFISLNLALLGHLCINQVKSYALKLVGYRQSGYGHLRRFSFEFNFSNLLYLVPLIFAFVLAFSFSVLQYALLWASRIAFAIISPERSASLVYSIGKQFKIGDPGSKLQNIFSYGMGGLGALVSLAISAFSWMLLLPLAISGLVTLFPSILVAFNWISQLPLITTSLAWLSQWPIITGTATVVNSFFGFVGGGLASVFGPAVISLASFISIQVPTTALTVGMTLGLIFIPIVAVISRGLDELSNLWAKWVEQAPVAAIIAFTSKLLRRNPIKENNLELNKIESPAPDSDKSLNETSSKSSKLYIYQPIREGIYIASDQALYLVREKNQFVARADQYIRGIILKGEKAEELRERANNVSLKGLCTQRVRFATERELKSTREDPMIPEGVPEEQLKQYVGLYR